MDGMMMAGSLEGEDQKRDVESRIMRSESWAERFGIKFRSLEEGSCRQGDSESTPDSPSQPLV